MWTSLKLLLFAAAAIGAQKCGYDSCTEPDPQLLNVHIIPHTHDDVGWLKTVDQYFYGSKSNIQEAAVQYILDGVIPELAKNADRKFTYVEMAYFYRWWMQQTNDTQNLVRSLVYNGQLHFTVGGWCMADEASTHYVSLIDEHTFGFRFLLDQFGDCGRPRAAWQIDPFGHSREVANLFAQFGFDGLYLGRIDYQDKQARWLAKQLEVVWRGSDDASVAQNAQDSFGSHDLFTGITPDGYGPLGGFCWDQFCGDDPVMDDRRLHDYNVDERVNEFVAEVKGIATAYSTNNIMLTMGSDFMWQNAIKWFVNLDKLIKYVNAKSSQTKVRAFYSTPACYTYAVNQAGRTYTVKRDDFFPYADKQNNFWSGYFTSRAAFKGYVREAESFLQTFRQMHALAKLGPSNGTLDSLFVLEEALGLAQHHDAVSGTEKQLVAYDYAQRLQAGLDQCIQNLLPNAYQKLMPLKGDRILQQQFCAYLNVSVCSVAQSGNVVITIYNPYARQAYHHIRLPAASAKATVFDPAANFVVSDIVPVSNSTRNIWNYMKAGHLPVTAVNNELVFEAKLPPFGWASYYVNWNSQSSPKKPRKSIPERGSFDDLKGLSNNFVIENSFLAVIFDVNSGLMTSIYNKAIKQTFNVTPTLKYYYAMDTRGTNQPSGAYIFRPLNNTALDFANPSVEYFRGGVVQEVRQTFANWATLVTRLYNGSSVELEWTVGPIPVGDNLGREVILDYKTDFANNRTCYTDANGRQMLRRVFNYRPTWNLTQTENVSGNYYPINSAIFMRDSSQKNQLTVLTDRSQGGGCIREGSVEVMLHRRLLHDDYLGVGEPLNEPGLDGKGLIVRGRHHLLVDSVARSGAQHRKIAMAIFAKPIVTFATGVTSFADYANKYRTVFSAIGRPLPENVNLLNLAFRKQINASTTQLLVRFEHFFQKDEDANLSQPVTFNFQNVINNLTFASYKLVTLGANRDVQNADRLSWNVASTHRRRQPLKYRRSHDHGNGKQGMNVKIGREENSNDYWEITLMPMDIATVELIVNAQ